MEHAAVVRAGLHADTRMSLDDGDGVAETAELCSCGEAGQPGPDDQCVEGVSHEAERRSGDRIRRWIIYRGRRPTTQRAVMLRRFTLVTAVGIITWSPIVPLNETRRPSTRIALSSDAGRYTRPSSPAMPQNVSF